MNDLKISRELLSEVLEYEVDVFLGVTESEIDYTCCKDVNEGYIDTSINIYEFAFKCKEWILNKGYSQLSGKDDIYEKRMGFVCSIGSTTLLIEDFYAGTEIEAIIKACEWILKERS